MLSLRGVEAAYDGIIVALRGVSLELPSGGIVALLGANGAGKTTTLKAASGLLSAEGGSVTAGHIEYQGQDIAGRSAHELVRSGLSLVLEGRHCFPHFTVAENLIAGALVRKPKQVELENELERVYGYFPRLVERRRSPAGLLSGGEQQMLAIGRALMSKPKLVLLDEPSMGLAPLVVEEIFEIIATLNRRDGVGFLLAEQNATLALRYAEHGYVLENGRVAISGSSRELSQRDDVKKSYLGIGRHDTALRRSRRASPTQEV
ncbi:MAG: ABC transporter ATP-binding protein [Polyangiaceae bacterium]